MRRAQRYVPRRAHVFPPPTGGGQVSGFDPVNDIDNRSLWAFADDANLSESGGILTWLNLGDQGAGDLVAETSTTSPNIVTFDDGLKSVLFARATADRLLSGDHASYAGSANRSLAFSMRTVTNNVLAFPLNKRNTAGTVTSWMIFMNASAWTLRRSTNGTTLTDVALGAVEPNGEWHHYAITNSGATWRWYIDGAQVATNTNGAASDFDEASSLRVGAAGNNPATTAMDAYIDNILVTTDVLTPDEVLSLSAFRLHSGDPV